MNNQKPDSGTSFSPMVYLLVGLVLLCMIAAAYLVLTKAETDKTRHGSATGEIKFDDDLVSNASPEQDFSSLMLTDSAGKEIYLKDFVGKSNLVFVVLRGYSYAVCPYCSAQTQRVINRYDEIKEQDANVVIAYPLNGRGDRDKLDLFIAAANRGTGLTNDELPLTLGVDFELKVVDALGIRADLSKPATYILDKSGKLRFAYVGDSLSDRPSVNAIINQLKQINGE
ncbi:peroxiredoxin family protein [Pirellulaceae bacterium]|jgi:peroxiredoxin|nr:peroxiredoxin family protein [Pirellulaceae bacterium]